jgi:TP901 family phage tail tape measure protein|uniref:Minor tail protein n=1 Tax=Caudovirales sp. ctFWA4 TaxID=2827628 RepID=A0A8S5LJA6_9CAUD|nr:MAG TPA: minor tail protein [Caudovirales sp. ctFWA4]
MLFALEAQLGREFRTTFAKARGELGDTADSAESFGSRATQAVDAVSSVLAAAGISAALKEIKEGFDECVQASMDFESAITGVAKTTDLTDGELADMSDAIKAMSTEIPASTTEIAAVAEAAGQLGIQKDALLDFTRVMTMLGTATNMTAEDAATALARFANITGMSADNYDRLGAVIVDLGNNFATTESEITQMGTRLASGGKLAGLTEPQIMALAAAMSSVGIEAEAGGTAMTQTLNAIEKAVATGEDSLQSFADVAGMSADSFAEMWNTDALGALTAFIRGLGNLDEQGESAVLVLEDLGLTGIRQSNMLKSLALAADQMDSAVQTANTAWDENIALTNEANKRYATTQSKLDMMQNAYNNLKVAVGDAFTPALRDAYDAGTDVLNVLGEFVQENPALVKGVATFTGVVGGATVALTAYAAISKVIKALDMATMFGGAVGPIMLGVTAVAALTAGIVALSDASKDDAVPSVRELTEAARELDSAMSDARAACDDTVTTTEASANVANNYIDRLDELNSLSKLSAEQQREYHGILVMLTQTVPDLANYIDLETDTINGGTEALRANTQAWKDNAIAQAYQEQLTEIYSKNADVLIEAEKNKIGLRDAEGKLAVAQKAQNDEFERQNRLYQEANQKVQEYYEETGLVTDANMWLGETTDELNWKLEQNAQAVMEAQDAVDAYQKAIDKDNDALQAAQDEIALAEEAVQNLTTATEDSTTATEDASRGYGELNTEISNVKECVEALQQAYQEAYEAAAESVQGQYALWQQADSIVATSASSINSNLQGQITHWQTYNDNLASLRDRAGDIEGLTEMIGSFADGSSDSVNAIAGMAAASDEELAAMVESWNKLREEQNKAAEDIADFRTGFSETMDAISGDLEDTIDGMDLGTEAAEAGRATIQGFIDGATGMLSTVQSAYSQLGYAALAALSRNVQNNNSVASSRRMSGFSRYASGTTSAEAGLALVGEEGPEFVMMHGGEAVLNAADTHSAIEAMTSTSDSSVPVQVNITVEGDVNDGVMERLETYGEEFAAQVRAVIREDNINAQRGAYR